MKISSKGRYGLSSMIYLAQNYDSSEFMTILSISEKLGISKVYLEQVFSLLKRSELVTSVKGPQGGYKLSKSPDSITAADILCAFETSLFEKTEQSAINDDTIEKAMQGLIFEPLDVTIKSMLEKVKLSDLINEIEKYKCKNSLMFYI